MRELKRFGPLVVVVGLLLGGAFEAGVEREDRIVGSMLIAAGLVVLGAWLAMEIRRDGKDDDEEPK